MIVYIKTRSGDIYASPVFAETGSDWKRKSVVLDEGGENLILLDEFRKEDNLLFFNYFYIDDTLPNGWAVESIWRGFSEIIGDSKIVGALEKGERVPVRDLQCVKAYDLPLKVVDKFTIENENDIAIFMTASLGLHDAIIEKIEHVDNSLTVTFDTTWERHIIMTFHGVTESNIDDVEILESKLTINDGMIKWEVVGAIDSSGEYYDKGHTYAVARKISWQLIIDRNAR